MAQREIFIIISFISLCHSEWDIDCHGCECKWSSGKKVANCTKGGLSSIPQDLHAEVQVLILDYNSISSLGANVFITNLPNLQKISLRHCGIKTIHENAFNGLKILVEIDLSNNNITKFGPKTFSGNNRLKTLNLSHNPIRNLIGMQFPPLPYLKTLDFSHCLLEQIDRTAFGNLGNSVEAIQLKGNQLHSLQEDIFLTTTNIKSLELHHNPWRCDCHLKQFRDWVVDRGLYNYPTTCKEPERLSEKMWDVVRSSEFACKPEIEVSKGTVYSQPGSNVTLSCFITGNPIPEAKWVLRGRIVTNNTSPLHGTNNQIYVIHEKGGFERWFNLTLVNISEDDADDYTCVGVNAGGVSEQNVSLTFDQPKISPDTHEPVESNPNFAVIIGATAAGSLLSIMACIIYCCCRCRKCKKNNGGQESYNGSIVGFSNTDQQSLIEPKGILKHRENSYSTSGAELPRFGQGSTCGYQEMQETRSLSQLSGKRSLDSNHTAISQATLHSFDAGQYPDLLDIPNRDQQASPTTNIPEPISPQMLDASSLIPTSSDFSGSKAPPDANLTCTCPGRELVSNNCDPAYCGIATAAILPPPPNFLSSESQVQTVPLNKHSTAFVTLPRNSRKYQSANDAEVRLVPFFDGVGPRTSANGSSESNPVSDEIPPVPPPAMFDNSKDTKEQSNKFVNFGCAECEGQAEHEMIKSLLKSKKGKGVKTTLTENPEELSFQSSVSKQEMWGDKRNIESKTTYSTLPPARSRSFSNPKKSRQNAENTQGSQV